MVESWSAAFLFLSLCLITPATMFGVAAVLAVRARTDSPGKYDTYECGEEPEGMAWIRFHPRYYLVALIFVLFDVEAAFLFPWAVSIRSVGVVAILEMLVFVGILLLGWGYALRKGALEWV